MKSLRCMLCRLEKHMTVFLGTNFKKFCRTTALMLSCYAPNQFTADRSRRVEPEICNERLLQGSGGGALGAQTFCNLFSLQK